MLALLVSALLATSWAAASASPRPLPVDAGPSPSATTPTLKQWSRAQAVARQEFLENFNATAVQQLRARASSQPSGCPGGLPSSRSDDYKLSTTIPGVPFPFPQSYGGYLSVNPDNFNDTRQLYFFYTEADAAASHDDIVIWFNGGPGCSSLEGLFQENGPVIFPYYSPGDSSKVILNEYSTHKAAHAIWIDSPGFTGFSKAGKHIDGFTQTADDIAGFLSNFFIAFPELHGKRLWLQGESAAGGMIPWMANRIYTDSTMQCKGINLKGFHINDPSWTNDFFMQEFAAFPFAQRHQQLLEINDTQLADIRSRAAVYGLDTYYDTYLAYPPKGPLPMPANWTREQYSVYGDVQTTSDGPHCMALYNIAIQCPPQLDPLGYPLIGPGPLKENVINDTPGFREAIHADPKIDWLMCNGGGFDGTNVKLPADTIMPYVIEQSEKVIIGGGAYDQLLISQGNELGVQNLTWGGAQGFQTGTKMDVVTEQGVRGWYITERKLTLVDYFYAGHMVPQDDQPAGLLTTKFLIGSVDSMA